MQWKDYLCSSPPILKEISQTSAHFNKQFSSSPKSKNKLNLSNHSKSRKKMMQELTSAKKMELDDSISILFARQMNKELDKKGESSTLEPILNDIRDIGLKQLKMTERLVKLLEEKSVLGKSNTKKEKSTVKKKKTGSTLTIEDRLLTKLKNENKSKPLLNQMLRKSRSTQKKQKSLSFIKNFR